jgi:hypothetical protein
VSPDNLLISPNQSNEVRSRVARNGVQTNQGVQVRMHLSSFIHLNTVDARDKLDNNKTSKMEKKEKRTWSSEHRRNLSIVMSANEKRVANMDAREVSICVLPDSNKKVKVEGKMVVKQEGNKAKEKEGVEDKCEEELPDNPPSVEQEEPPEDAWFCPQCSDSPCQFLQWQEELEKCVTVMTPDLTNKEKRYRLYCHVSRRRHGMLGKGNRRPIPSCLEQGMRDLYPSEKYTGYKSAYDSGPDDGSTPVYSWRKTN